MATWIGRLLQRLYQSTTSLVIAAACWLLGLLIVLPALMTLAHLFTTVSTSTSSSSSSSTEQVPRILWVTTTGQPIANLTHIREGWYVYQESRQSFVPYSNPQHHWWWQEILDLSQVLQLLFWDANGYDHSAMGYLVRPETDGSWCFRPYDHTADHHEPKVCSETLLGEYQLLSTTTTTHQHTPFLVSVSSAVTVPSRTSDTIRRNARHRRRLADDVTTTSHGFRRNPHKQQRPIYHRQSFAETLTWHRPATLFWLCINIGLALVYHFNKVSPRVVGKVYSRMVPTPSSSSSSTTTTILSSSSLEPWRCWTGATAHFEVWHLFFNCQSLAYLGYELEGRGFPSIVFWLYNISLIPLTSLLWMGLEYGQRTYLSLVSSSQRTNPMEDRPTVGYSGVLFAWMVIAALEQPTTCPVLFWPSLCFTTHNLSIFGSTAMTFKWSWAPIIQLVVAQVILPRVSLSGHLAGMICGYAIHWGLLPIRWTQPALVVPLLYWLHLFLLQKAVPLPWTKVSSDTGTDDDGPYANTALLVRISYLHLAVSLLSVWVYGPLCSLTLSFVFCAVFWHNSVQLVTGRRSDKLVVKLQRGYIVCAVITAVAGGMTLGSWLLLPSPSARTKPTFSAASLSPTFGLLLLQCLILLLGICICSCSLPTTEDKGIFGYTLGYTVVRQARICGDFLMRRFGRLGFTIGDSESSGLVVEAASSPNGETMRRPGASWQPFSGQGQRLGSISSSPSNRNRGRGDVELATNLDSERSRLV